MHRLLSISTDTTAFPWEHSRPVDASISVLAIAVALVLGELTGHTAAGAIMASGAFAAGSAALNPVMRSSFWAMALTTVGVASATLVGSLCAHSTALTLMVAALAAFNYAVLAHLTPGAGAIGQQCGVYAIVAGYFAGGLHFAAGRMSMVLLGGALQIVLHIVVAVFRDRHSLRSALHAPFWQRSSVLLGDVRSRALNVPAVLLYAARLLLTLVLATAIYRFFHMRNGYWIPMTALLVLKPEWTNTLSRGVARLIGTFGGALFALAVSRWLLFHHDWLAVSALLAVFACFTLQMVNYALYSFFITLYIVFLFAFGGFSEHFAAHLRLLNTATGGALALGLDAAWLLISPAFAKPNDVSPASSPKPSAANVS